MEILSPFVESGGELYVTLGQISSNAVDFDITTDGATNVATVNLDVATSDVYNDDTVGLGADNDDTVGLNISANDTVGPDVAADDAVGLNVATDGASKDDSGYLSVLTNQPPNIPYDIWEKILCHAISQLGCSWPNQRCGLFTRIRCISRQLYQIIETLKIMLLTIYISD